MAEVRFRLHGLTEAPGADGRRRATRRPLAASPLAWAAAAVVGAATIGTSTPVELADTLPLGTRRVIVVADASGSMQGAEARLAAQIAAVEALGIPSARHSVNGFGVAAQAGAATTPLLQAIEAAVAADPSADALYVFSDFQYGTKAWDASNDEGYQRLEDLLRRRELRLFLGTVRNDPPERFTLIARRSGGDVVAVGEPGRTPP